MTLTQQLKKLGAAPGDLVVFEEAVAMIELLNTDGNFSLWFPFPNEKNSEFHYSQQTLVYGKFLSLIRPPPEFWKPETWVNNNPCLSYYANCIWNYYPFQKLLPPAEEEYTEIKVRVKKGQKVMVVDE